MLDEMFPDINKIFEGFEDKSETQQEAAYAVYTETMYNSNFNDEWGMFDYGLYNKAQDKLKRDLGTEMFNMCEQVARYDDDYPPLYQELQQARKTLKPYWEIKDKVLDGGGPMKRRAYDLIVQYKARDFTLEQLEGMGYGAAVSVYREATGLIQQKRDELRKFNFGIDQALKTWY